jgi:Na+-translocating ferredoxin:NAD+ oxidoreductase RnfG subunit
MLLQLTLLVPIIAVSAILVTVSGCTDPVSTGTLQIETVHDIFPSATDISKMSISRGVQTSRRPGNHIISEIRDSSGLLGYGVESVVVSRSGPFKIAVVLDKQLVVKRATVVSYPWPRGRNVVRRAFTSQFEGKGAEDPIEVGKDIDAMTGATISCRVMAEGVREAIKLLKYIKASQAVKPSGNL